MRIINSMIKIGYQGINGSNSEIVAKKFQKSLNVKSELIGLITSKNVIEELKNKSIDYGVLAYENNIGGVVEETRKALKEIEYEIIDKILIHINHCVFKKKNVSINDIKNIASHIQAIKQTQKTINSYFKNLNVIEIKDTALGAKMLSEGLLSDDTIVICNKEIGLKYNLDIILENISDRKNNQTTFLIIKLNNIKQEL